MSNKPWRPPKRTGVARAFGLQLCLMFTATLIKKDNLIPLQKVGASFIKKGKRFGNQPIKLPISERMYQVASTRI
jgi:hypothetical protein